MANLGTEHRANIANLRYHGNLARKISEVIGPRIVLHGCSSVPSEQVKSLYDDGVAKVNIWTTLERDSSPILLENMARNAAKICGHSKASFLADEGILGKNADLKSQPELGYYTTHYRQSVVFEEMKRIAKHYFDLWYV